MTVNRKWFYRFLITILSLLLIGSVNLIQPTVAVADPSDSIEIMGDGVTNSITFSRAELEDMKQYQHVYSTINTWPTKKWYVGRGVKLRELLARAGMTDEAKLLTFTSTDGYSVTLTVKELLQDKRYYFPGLKDNHPSDGSVAGSADDAKSVEPIVALVSVEGSENPDAMNDMDSIMLMCGQRVVTEQTNNLFLKYISKIEVSTTPPPKWDSPRANFSGGEVPTGTLIELSSKRSDDDKVHYTTDGSTPTINSPVFNWSASRWWTQRPDTLKSINKPIELKKDTVIKARTIGPGKEDSDVVTFTYQVGSMTDQELPSGPPTEVTLDQEEINLKVGGTFFLQAIVGPDYAEDKRVTWSSSNTRVAVVDNHGLITVVGPGTAVISATTVVGNLTAACKVIAGSREAVDKQAAPVELIPDKQEKPEVPADPETEVPETDQPDRVEKEAIPEDSADADRAEELLAETEVPEANQRYLAPKEAAAADITTTDISVQPEDNPAGHIIEVSIGDTVPLQMQNRWNTCVAIIFIFLFLSGAVKKYVEYTKEVAM